MERRLQLLEQHLADENPTLLESVKSFRKLDEVAYRLGLMDRDQSFAAQVPWWPLISILGTFSAGKSSFINTYLGVQLQNTGTQAVDDKFTVITFSNEPETRCIPGRALDADPRFPFFRISKDIEEVEAGEGGKVDSYLQLKTVPSEVLRGKILIDSPGFDADNQRDSTLRITDYIIGLSDLVLVFFDARHPEPGAMKDTLQHLVGQTKDRADATKFLYVLNQIDVTAREDNPEEVVAAWQRALSQQGLTAGNFYRIYNKEIAPPIEDEARRLRFETKLEEDLGEIHSRIRQVEIERAYRIVGVLSETAKNIRDRWIPDITRWCKLWRKQVLWGDGIVGAILLVLFAVFSIQLGWWTGFQFTAPWFVAVQESLTLTIATVVGIVVVLGAAHCGVRKLVSKRIKKKILKGKEYTAEVNEMLARAFGGNTRPFISIFHPFPVWWNVLTRKKIERVLLDADKYIQELNDRFTDPSGKKQVGKEKVSQVNQKQEREKETVENQAVQKEPEK